MVDPTDSVTWFLTLSVVVVYGHDEGTLAVLGRKLCQLESLDCLNESLTYCVIVWVL